MSSFESVWPDPESGPSFALPKMSAIGGQLPAGVSSGQTRVRLILSAAKSARKISDATIVVIVG